MAGDTFGGLIVVGVVAASLVVGAVTSVMTAGIDEPKAIDGGPLHHVELAPENTQGFHEALINSGFRIEADSLATGRAVCHDMIGTYEKVLGPKYGEQRGFDFINIAHQHLCKITKVDGAPIQ